MALTPPGKPEPTIDLGAARGLWQDTPAASIPAHQLEGVDLSHLQQPCLAQLDAAGSVGLFPLLSVPQAGLYGGLDRTLYQFARSVLQANKANMNKGRLQRELPYWTAFGMNIVLFGIGLAAFGLAIYRGWSGDPVTAATFGGITITSIIGTFLLSPIASLQRSNLLNTGLVCVINTYWTRLMYLQDPMTMDADLKRVTEETVNELDLLRAKYLDKTTSQTAGAPALQ